MNRDAWIDGLSVLGVPIWQGSQAGGTRLAAVLALAAASTRFEAIGEARIASRLVAAAAAVGERLGVASGASARGRETRGTNDAGRQRGRFPGRHPEQGSEVMGQGVKEQTICWIEGKILPASEARIPVLDHGFLFGDGVFEGIRVTHRGIFRFADHMKRLETAARAIGLAVPGGFERVHEAARETTRAWGPREGYLRLVVTRGVGALGIDPSTCPEPGDRLHRDRCGAALAREGRTGPRSHHLESAPAARRRPRSARQEPELPEQRAGQAGGDAPRRRRCAGLERARSRRRVVGDERLRADRPDPRYAARRPTARSRA